MLTSCNCLRETTGVGKVPAAGYLQEVGILDFERDCATEDLMFLAPSPNVIRHGSDTGLDRTQANPMSKLEDQDQRLESAVCRTAAEGLGTSSPSVLSFVREWRTQEDLNL